MHFRIKGLFSLSLSSFPSLPSLLWTSHSRRNNTNTNTLLFRTPHSSASLRRQSIKRKSERNSSSCCSSIEREGERYRRTYSSSSSSRKKVLCFVSKGLHEDEREKEKEVRMKDRRTDDAGADESTPWLCPACFQRVRLPERLARHMYKCCPELVTCNSVQMDRANVICKKLPANFTENGMKTTQHEEEQGAGTSAVQVQVEEKEEESSFDAKRHEATWQELRARPKAAGALSEKERRAAEEALDFAVERERRIRKAAAFVAFYSPRIADVADEKKEPKRLFETSLMDDLSEEIELKLLADPVTLPLHEREKLVQEHLKLASSDRVHKLLKKRIKSEPLVADSEGVEVIYEDDVCLCVNKPPLLRTAPRHRFEGKSLVNRIVGYIQKQKGAAAGAKPYVLHRLDMDTSGVVLMSKQKELAAVVSLQFRERRVKKYYLAICCGNPPDTFVVDDALERDMDHEIAMKVSKPSEPSDASKPSKTLFVTIARNQELNANAGEGLKLNWQLSELHPFSDPSGLKAGKSGTCLVCAMPLTGRTHQIRVHLAHAGYPIIGDPLYGMLCGELMERQALHAFKLQLDKNDASMLESTQVKKHQFLAPLPKDMSRCLSILNIENKQVDTINSIVDEALVGTKNFL